MIDVWHFYNGGAKLDVLDDLPGAGVAAVQLNDRPLVDGDFLKHARAQRTLPGEGELDVVGLIRAVQATGYSGTLLRRGQYPGISRTTRGRGCSAGR